MISLHQTFLERFSNYKILEVSTKSKVDVGVKASAFNLTIETKKGNTFSVEELFQTSKVYKKMVINPICLKIMLIFVKSNVN